MKTVSSNMKKDIYATLQYFKQFQYAPNITEIHIFCRTVYMLAIVQAYLDQMIKTNKINLVLIHNIAHYYIPTGSISKKTILKKFTHTLNKINKIKFLLFFLKHIPTIQFIGLTGSCAMYNANKNDDIDLCIISSNNYLYTTRILCLCISHILGLRRKRNTKNISNTACFNLFFDMNNVVIPACKKTYYIAHEIIQMKMLINKNHTYEKFIHKNSWIFNFFPNSKQYISIKYPSAITLKKHAAYNTKAYINTLGRIIELLCKKIQIMIINKHKTHEIINKNQLWFFPDDFENKVQIFHK